MITINGSKGRYFLASFVNIKGDETITLDESVLALNELEYLITGWSSNLINISPTDVDKIKNRILSTSEMTPDLYIPISEKGDSLGVATLDSSGKVPTSQLPSMSSGGEVSSVNGQTGTVNLSANDVGAATSEQGAKADSALQPSDVSTAGKTGNYNDLTNKPTIPVLPTLATVATSGSYTDLSNKPDLTLKQDSLPTNGTAGQFLAHDMTFKTPSGGDGLNELPNNSSSKGIGGMGFEIGSPISGSIYDNSKLPYYDAHISDTGSPITVPLFFKETVTISAIGLGIVEGGGGWVSLGIYSSHPVHGYPYQRLWTEENCISAGSVGVRLTTLDFTLEKNNVYWVQITGSYTRLQGLNTTFGAYCIGASTKTGVNPFSESVENRCHQITSPGSQFAHLKPYFNYTGSSALGSAESPLDKEGFKNGSRGIPRIFVQVA